MKRISYWLLSTLSALVLLFGYHTSTSGAEAAASSNAVVSTGKAGTSASSGTSSGTTSSGSSGTTSSGSSSSSTKTTTVTGSIASTQWGPVQLKLTMSGATI